MANKRKKSSSIKGQKKSKTAVIVLALVVLLSAVLDKTGILTYRDIRAMFAGTVAEDTLELHFIDVGQGDSELIIIGENAMLIDAGEKDEGGKVAKYLIDHGIKKLDYVIATHPHSDHIGGIPGAVNEMTVENFIIPEIPEEYMPTTKAYENLLIAIDESGANLEYGVAQAKYNLGSAVFTIIAPNAEYKEMNEYSVVILLEYNGYNFLLMGDAEKKSENDILENHYLPKIDVFKLGHHGSDTSSSQAFIDIIQPKYAVIEVGAGNSYGHPSSDVVTRLSKYFNEVYRTDINGTIIFTVNGKDMTVKKEK